MCEGITCKYCGGTRINKYSKQNNKQRYLCRDCKRTFIIDTDDRIKYNDRIKVRATRLYLKYMSVRSIERILQVSDTTISRWISDFIETMKNKAKNDIDNVPNNIKDLRDNLEVLTGDEIINYMKKNLKSLGNNNEYGLLLTGKEIKLLVYK